MMWPARAEVHPQVAGMVKRAKIQIIRPELKEGAQPDQTHAGRAAPRMEISIRSLTIGAITALRVLDYPDDQAS